MRLAPLVLSLVIVLLAACSTPNQGASPRETAASTRSERPSESGRSDGSQAPSAEETPEATEGSEEGVIFSDDFSDPATGWFEGDASFDNSFENGTLQGEYTDDETLGVMGEVAVGFHTVVGTIPATSVAGGALEELEDVTIEVDVEILERREVGTVGVVCRQDPLEGSFYTAYLLIESGFPLDARIARSDSWEKDVEQLAVSEPLLADADDATGRSFHLRLDCIGDTITLAVDGDVVAEATDATYDEGGVGLEYVSFMEDGLAEEGRQPLLVLEYDNFELREPAPAD